MTILESLDLPRVSSPGSPCVDWPGTVNAGGYGQVTYKRRHWVAHRLAYTLYRGPVPEGLDLDHLCRNRRCVNPWHLEAVTRRENLLRGNTLTAINAAKVACQRGHPLSGENLVLIASGRACRTCINMGQAAWREANPARRRSYEAGYQQRVGRDVYLARRRAAYRGRRDRLLEGR